MATPVCAKMKETNLRERLMYQDIIIMLTSLHVICLLILDIFDIHNFPLESTLCLLSALYLMWINDRNMP